MRVLARRALTLVVTLPDCCGPSAVNCLNPLVTLLYLSSVTLALSCLPRTCAWSCPEKKPKKAICPLCVHDFSIYLAAGAAKYCGKGSRSCGKSFGKGLERVWKVFIGNLDFDFEILEMPGFGFEILEMHVFGAWRRQKQAFHWF